MDFKKYAAMFLVMLGLAVAPSVLTGCEGEEDLGDEMEDVGDDLGN